MGKNLPLDIKYRSSVAYCIFLCYRFLVAIDGVGNPRL